jgi:glycosyltransferase involved in cell wall biosynthesis
MSVGGFVIHGNNRETLGACLESLVRVCDEVVAIDSHSSDGSHDLVRSRGIPCHRMAWQGYGAARARALELLGPRFDYFFYLDSDEHLAAGSEDILLGWKESAPSLPAYKLARRNWARIGERRFVYRVDHRARLIRRDVAGWSSSMIVHEALPGLSSGSTGAIIEHEFATHGAHRVDKDVRYALLWAIQAHRTNAVAKPQALQRLAHVFKDVILSGLLFRAGVRCVPLAWRLSLYHGLKYRFLQRVRAGEFSEFVSAYELRELEKLFQAVNEIETLDGVANPGRALKSPDGHGARVNVKL